MKTILAIFALLASSFAANHYVRQGASGSGDGSDWTNACTDFATSCSIANLVRGDTYYVATGSYAARTWNKATSGTSVITIKRATIADHGTATGWSDAYDGNVTWASGHDVQTSYWVFDGVTYPTTAFKQDGGDVAASYGFQFAKPGSCASNYDAIGVSGNITDITFRGIAITACGGAFDTNQWAFLVDNSVSTPINNLVISHAFFDGFVDLVQMQGASSIATNHIYEYIYSVNNGGSATHHGEPYQLICAGCTIRYNYFADCGSSGVTACISGNAAGTSCGALVPMCNTKIYGNVFRNAASGNGVIHAAGSTGIGGTEFYNNTIVTLSAGNYFDECSGHTCPSGSGNNIVKNNIIWSSICGIGQFGLTGDVESNNTFLSCTSGAASGTSTQTGSFNPFVASASQNYKLTAAVVASCASGTATCAGVSLSSPFNVDAYGTTRGLSGQWARGAFDFPAAGGAASVSVVGTTVISGGVAIH